MRPARSELGFQEITIKVAQAGEVFCTLKRMRTGIELQLEGADPSMSTLRLN